MNMLDKVWIRILLSLLGGSIIAEFLKVSSNDPNKPTSVITILILAAILLGLLNWIVKRNKRNNNL